MASILNVDKIRATGSTTDGLIVDSSGHVTRPQLIAFQAQKNDITASGGEYSTTGNITFNYTLLSHSAWNGTTFTAPVAGKYRFTVNGHKQSTASSSAIELTILKGGSAVLAFYSLGAVSDRPRVHGEVIVDLAVNDTITFSLTIGDVFAGGANGGSGVSCSGLFLG